MNPPHDRNRHDRPTIAEVVALTRRMRELSSQGHDADPAERAAFLAEKDALLARIADSAAGPAPGRELHHHRSHLNRTDGPDYVEFDTEDSQWHPGGSARLDLPHPDALPPWEQPAYAVDGVPEQIIMHDAGPRTAPVGLVPCCSVVDSSELDDRREQLARWHDEAIISGADAAADGLIDPPYGDAGNAGWAR